MVPAEPPAPAPDPREPEAEPADTEGEPSTHLEVEVVPAEGPQVDGAETPTGEPEDPASSSGDLQSAVAPSSEEVARLRDQLARALADYDNLSRRATRERLESAKYANQGLIEKLLPSLDDLMRACRVAEGEQLKALEMVRDRLLGTLQDHGLEPVDHDIPFDPNLHEALVVETASAEEDGTILDVIEQGYLLGGRLLRPSRVRVVQKE